MYKDDKVVAIARLDCADKNIAQVRFVAVDPNFRGMGYGKKIMKSTEEYSKKRGDRKMILHARDYAVDFYLGLGYQKIEKSYKLFGTLQHYLMEKVY